ncbi:MAG: type I restriction enzyme HsdR N-terminal domain-containing protein [Balneolaceae bacterium]
MDSPVAHHFPPVAFRQGKKYLWNRIHRKTLENQPEERVRLRYIDYLVLETGWPQSRIASEAAVQRSDQGYPLRADLICYSKDLKPEILVECKSESVSLNEVTAIQAARYNRTLNANFICITNGILDYWYQMKSKKAVELNKSPLQLKTGLSQLRRHPGYWQDRGFVGKTSSASIQHGLTRILSAFWSDEYSWTSKYLNIRQKLQGLQFNHYYRLVTLDPARRLALTFLRSADERSYVGAILNENHKNRGMLLVNLDQLSEGQAENCRLYTNDKQLTLDARTHLPIHFTDPDPRMIRHLPEHIDQIFQKYR